MSASEMLSDGSEELDGGNNQFVTFAVAGEMFAVPMGPVQEIIRVPDVARLPLAPHTLDGLANLRGQVLPIINLRRLFGCDEREHDDATRAVVINLGQPLGFVVDRVASVISVEAGEIEPAAAIQSVVSADYLTGVIKRPRAGGGMEMLMTVDFASLIEGQFSTVQDAARGQRAGGHAGGMVSAEESDEVVSDDLRLVSFSVAGQEYALDIAEVQEIVQLPDHISALPNTPRHVMGVMSLRQRLLPLVSLRCLFGLPEFGDEETQRVVVTSLPGGLHVGLVTDAVKEVLSIPRALAEPMPGILSADQQLQEFASICRLEDGKRLVSVIATDRLLRMPAIQQAIDASEQAEAALSKDKGDAMNDDMNDVGNGAVDDDTQVVIFRLGAEEFGVPIMSVQEIVRVPETLTRVPKTPSFVEGVINLRGTVLPVIDQRARLGLPTVERNDGQRIMVYLLAGMRTGFIVDSVAEVLRIPRGDVAAAPQLSSEQSLLISRVANLEGGKRLVMLLDPAHLLQGDEVHAMGGLMTGTNSRAAGEAAVDALPQPKAA